MTTPAQGDPARFLADQIVVATPHRELVLQELQSFRNEPQLVTPGVSDPLLGLSIINVETKDSATLDALMTAVRKSCEKKYAGWVPTMGKNRLLDRIEGGGEVPAKQADEQLDGVVGGAEPIERARVVNGVRASNSYNTGGGGGLPKRANEGDIMRFNSVLEHNKGRGEGIKVALLDTEIYQHPEFDRKIDEKALPNGGETVPYPDGHATFVAGLIYQQAPSIDLKSVNVLNNQGVGDAWNLASKMVRLAHSDHPPKVLNLSWGCFTDDNLPPLLFRRAVELLTPNTVIVAAAGNHGCRDTSEFDVEPNAPFWPAALDYVIGVGAKNNSNERASFTPAAEWVRLLEPGDQVTSTFPENVEVPRVKGPITIGRYAKWSGTSFAAAAITGRIAALLADDKLPYPPAFEFLSLSAEELEARLKL